MLVEDLRGLIARKKVVLVVGTGVSVSATGNAPTASWKGLLLPGVKRCQELNPSLPARWVKAVLASHPASTVKVIEPGNI
jgi:hypothetical protein